MSEARSDNAERGKGPSLSVERNQSGEDVAGSHKAPQQPQRQQQQEALDELEFDFGAHMDGDALDADADAQHGNGDGSALATAKLSSKKKEALSQVPCKFFRSNGCSAGNSCPFAHIQPGEGQGKAVCQWFLKGNCRFGHRCALAHILPGQPMSMDRKNKRAAQQQQQNGGGMGGFTQQAHLGSTDVKRFSLQSHLPHHQGAGYDGLMRIPNAPTTDFANGGGPMFGTIPQQGLGREGMGGAGDLMFGVPDDLQQSYPHATGAGGQQRQSDWQAMGGGEVKVSTSPSSNRRAARDAGVNFSGPMSTSNASQAFGTSPFSQPGSLSVFYSAMQSNDNDARELGRSQSRADEDAVLRAAARRSWGEDEHAEEFLPSSLSDLLTPEELERRRRNVLGSKHQWLSRAAAPNGALGTQGDLDDLVSQSVPANGLTGVGHEPWSFDSRTSRNDANWSSRPTKLDSSSSNVWNSSTTSHRVQGLPSRLGVSNTSNGFLSTRLQADNHARQGNGHSAAEDQLHLHSYSPDVAHAPGQSLPQGLAAGLSRLHLRSMSNSGSGLHAARSRLSSDLQGPTADDGAASSSPGVIGGLRVGGNGNHADELAPVAPSSIFAHHHRGTPFGRSMMGSSPSTSTSFDARSVPHSQAAIGIASASIKSNYAAAASSPYGASPHKGNGSSHLLPGSQPKDGIAIPSGGNAVKGANNAADLSGKIGAGHQQAGATSQNGPGGTGVGAIGLPPHHRHPGMHRIRGTSSAAIGASPLSLPTTGEEVEDAIFELE